MIIFSINKSHNASACLLIDGKIIFSLESERISNIKYDFRPFSLINILPRYVDHIDHLIICGISPAEKYDLFSQNDPYTEMIKGLGKSFYDYDFMVHDFGMIHHETHAASSFYNSGFKEAICIVKDGMGSSIEIGEGKIGREISSVFHASYPSNFKLINKKFLVPVKVNNSIQKIAEQIYITDSVSEGKAFEFASEALGFTLNDAGKVMGMASYSSEKNNFKIYDEYGAINKELFSFNEDYSRIEKNFYIEKDFESRSKFAASVQYQIQENVTQEILDIINSQEVKNICLSGGLFLNCTLNFNIKKKIKKDINLYIEPASSDAGTAIGAAYYLYNNIKNNKNPLPQQSTVYYGPKYTINVDHIKNKIENVSEKFVAEIISKKNIVAIFQGGSENGPRALGNRSILYDPRDPNGKDIVNKVKKREWFRPFAGTVLEEKSQDWFDMAGLTASPFMMFAVDVKEDKKNIIPSITHVDGTCRIQTINEKQNKNFYNLIKSFYEITGVPILFNTSFNLAGDCIVETPENAIKTFENSDINYLYFPEIKTILFKE